jgi:hypothetical protein
MLQKGCDEDKQSKWNLKKTCVCSEKDMSQRFKPFLARLQEHNLMNGKVDS